VVSSSLPFSSFGEFANCVLGIQSSPVSLHIAGSEKTPTFATVPSSSSRMVYHFVDPRPFMPPRAQRVMVLGHPTMMRVVTGRVQEHNNDVAIARLHPLSQEQMNFEDIRNVLEDFLHVHLGIPTLII